jgi:hypothetical protein
VNYGVEIPHPSKKSRWLGRLILPGLFDRKHIFEINKMENIKTLFI